MGASVPPPYGAQDHAVELARSAQLRATPRSAHRALRPSRGAAAYYRRTARKRVRRATAIEFLPLHREAGRRYGVAWRLLASIHRQETAFSAASTTYHGLNDFGCCAGPMQFNVTNGPVSTWKLYRDAFRAGGRPKRYPHRTRHHPSIYDDFDAIMAAAALLRDSGAGTSLDERAWQAAYSYYGHDLYGVTYANEVLARAVAWERDGFCPNCAVDPSLVDQFDDAYGRAVRRELTADDRRREKLKERRRRAAARARRARTRRARRERAASERAARQPPARIRPSKPPRADDDAAVKPPAPPATPADTTTTPADITPTATTPAPAPPPAPCSAIEKLLGDCR